MIAIDEKFLAIKEINGYLVDMILINSIRSGNPILVPPLVYHSMTSDIHYNIILQNTSLTQH
jgi:hypothetical protein